MPQNLPLQEAFLQVCREAQPPPGHYLSLYARQPFFGGPQEGGWWGEDVVLVASQAFPSEEALEAARVAVEALAVQLSQEARRAFDAYCLRTTEWLESRGLDADFLPEVDGETQYMVVTETEVGSAACRGNRQYA